MEFFFDVDGVLLDFEASFVDMMREYYLPHLPKGFVPKTWALEEDFQTVDIEEAWDRFLKSDRLERLDPLVNIQQFNQISDLFKVYLVTNLPNEYYLKREKNLHLLGMKYTGLYLAGHMNFGDESYPGKAQSIAKVRNPEKQIIFLDDSPRNCMDVKEAFPDSQVFLMERPHNETVKDQEWIRVKNWNEFINQFDFVAN
ncbi:MAG: hypothetical protein ACI86H_000084 [bacterium]|jgi:hypothetical protein